MKPFLNLQDITGQIQHYVRKIKARQPSSSEQTTFDDFEQILFSQQKEIKSNINKLDGKSKFSIQTLVNTEKLSLTTNNYASEAYNHLTHIEDKDKVIIDFMHKNNRNYDLDV